jgi:hypothetical protein
MRTFSVLALAVLVFFSCKKGQGIHLVPGPTDSTDIVGQWKLEASRIGFAIANHDTGWKTPAGSLAIVGFASSGAFTSDNNYAYKDEQYDRYIPDTTLLTGTQFQLVATILPTGNVPIYHGHVQMVNKDALIITYMGVDYSPQELYIRK